MPIPKGKSGNPLGRPRGSAGLAAFIRTKTKDFTKLVVWMLKIARTSASDRDRIAAIIWLADRGLGKVQDAGSDIDKLAALKLMLATQPVGFELVKTVKHEIEAETQEQAVPASPQASQEPRLDPISTPDVPKGSGEKI